jgi:hypothetical protein
MTITNTQTTLARQLDALAPSTLTYGGKAYRRSSLLAESDGLTLRQDYIARKARGAVMGDKVSFTVSYDIGSDTYDVHSAHFDGETFCVTYRKSYSYIHAEQLAGLGKMV